MSINVYCSLLLKVSLGNKLLWISQTLNFEFLIITKCFRTFDVINHLIEVLKQERKIKQNRQRNGNKIHAIYFTTKQILQDMGVWEWKWEWLRNGELKVQVNIRADGKEVKTLYFWFCTLFIICLIEFIIITFSLVIPTFKVFYHLSTSLFIPYSWV